MAPQISIIGGGIAGLVLGQCLRRRQIPAIIWEKSTQFPASSLQNFGITLYPAVYKPLLQHLDLDETSFYEKLAIRSGTRRHTDGEPIRVNRTNLLRALSENLDIRWNHKITGLGDGAQYKHKLVFEHDGNETSHESDLVFVADGVHSASRNRLNLDSSAFRLEVLPYVVYNGKRRFKSDAMPLGLNAVLDSATGLSHSNGNVVLQITSGYHDTKKDEIAINYTLSRPASKSDDDLLGRTNAEAESLAKRFTEEASSLRGLEEPFKTIYEPKLMQDDRLLHWLMRIAVIDTKAASKLAAHGIVLLGDAAHPQPILGGAGANAAITDGLRIAEATGTDASVALGVYEDLQQQWSAWETDCRDGIQVFHHQIAQASI